MPRQFAADDYEAIHKRQQELKPEPQAKDFSLPELERLMGLEPTVIPDWAAMTPEEQSAYVAQKLLCRSVLTTGGIWRCGHSPNFHIRNCWANGRCMTNSPRP